MKKLIISMLMLGALTFASKAQTIKTDQSCNPYFLLNEGSHWTTKNYNAKDKYQGKQKFEVLSVEGSAEDLIATVRLIAYDKKDEEIMNDEMTFTCVDGVLEMDMSEYVPKEMEESMKSMDFEIETESTTLPEKLKLGQKLDDGSVTLKVRGPMPISLKTEIIDRKVESKENISVPAGNFEAFKITSTLKSSGMMKMKRQNVEYVAEGVGVVRTESYNKKGKLANYSVLSSFKK